jgi:hypothetical protein
LRYALGRLVMAVVAEEEDFQSARVNVTGACGNESE